MLTFPVASGFVTTYADLVTVRTFLGLVEGPLTPGIILLLSSFYTRKELAFRYVTGLLSGVNHPSIDYLESPYFCHHLRCVVECRVNCFSFLCLSYSAVWCFFRITLCRNREYEWHWWKTRMGLDLYSCSFWIHFQFLQFSTTFIGRIVYGSRRCYWFFLCTFYTTPFQILN